MAVYFSYAMVFLGSILMAYNIFRYIHFAKSVRQYGNWSREKRLFNIPILLLLLFLLGYIAVAMFGKPDLVIGGILLGGSVFVLVMLVLIQRTVSRIRENDRLEAKVIAAEDANRAKTAFFSNMSHDLRTPLNAIVGYTNLAKGSDSREKQTEYIEKIGKASRQLLGIVNDVLEMSRIESGKAELSPEPTDIEELVRSSGDLVRAQLAEKNIAFTLSCEVRDRWVDCDGRQLGRVLLNLLGNAVKFTPEGGEVALTLKELSGGETKARYEIAVRDTGIGMSPEFVESIFTPFERDKNSANIQGTGLGMAITKSIVDMMKGDIQVETELGKGSAFIITLDMALCGEPQAKPEAAPNADLIGRRLLLAEDNAVNTEIAVAILTQFGFEVDVAENGMLALDRVASSPAGYYDAVLMDMQMPVMDGITATKAIRSLSDGERAQIPIIAMTANVFQEDIDAAKNAGMNAYITKPIEVDAMIAAIAGSLRR